MALPQEQADADTPAAGFSQETLHEFALTQAGEPGQSWLGTLIEDGNVRFEGVATANESWDFDHSGLTQEGTIAAVVVVSVFTGGSGAAMLNSAAGSTVVSGASAAMANAAFTSFAVQGALGFANSGGDIGAAFNAVCLATSGPVRPGEACSRRIP